MVLVYARGISGRDDGDYYLGRYTGQEGNISTN